MDEKTNGNGFKWRSRRRMAIAAFAWFIIQTLLIFYTIPIDKLRVLGEPITWSYFVLGGIVTAYMGFKAFARDSMNQ